MLDTVVQLLTRPWYLYFRDAFESDTAGMVFVLVLLAMGILGLILWWDSYDFFDFSGAMAILLAFLLISPLILVGYVAAKMLAWIATYISTRVSFADEKWFYRYRQVMRHRRIDPKPLSQKDYAAISALKIDTEISDAEKDSNVEDYLMRGLRDEAIKYVRDMLTVARSMADKKAIARYEKYFLNLRLARPSAGRPPDPPLNTRQTPFSR